MYYCKVCGGKFEVPQKIYETHGFSTPPYEEFFVCPICNSPEIKEISRTHCRCCGALLSRTQKEYCSVSCRTKGEILWREQIKKIKRELGNPINILLRELKAYNLQNGTNYSYGQYVALKFMQRNKEKCTKKKSNI